MPDPVSIGAAIGWGVSGIGWLVSPIISRVLNKGFAHLYFDAAKKLKTVDTQVLQLQRALEVVNESTYRARLEPLLDKLRSALYEAEDILDRVDYKSLKKQIQDAKSEGSIPPFKMDLLRKNLRSAMPSSPLKDKVFPCPHADVLLICCRSSHIFMARRYMLIGKPQIHSHLISIII